MVYRRRGQRTWLVIVPTRTGRTKRSTGTTHRPTARAMEHMLEVLGPRAARAWDLLDRIADGSLALPVLFDAYTRNDLDGLRARLTDVDLTTHIPGWTDWLADRVKSTTADHYLAHLWTLMPEGEPYWRSALTPPAVARWLATRRALTQKRRPSATASRRAADPPARPVSGSTKRRYLAAVQSFARYLVELQVLVTNPVRDVRPPPPNPPRCQFLELPEVLQLVESAAPPYQALLALAYGAGLEVSAMLALAHRDVEPAHRQIRARGTKAWTRDRVVRVADWAWPHVAAHLATLGAADRLFAGIDRWEASSYHRARLAALELPPLRLHDARHHWAVRMIRAGAPLELVARQLGHRDVTMVAKVYGRFVPTDHERDRWERLAAARDAERWPSLGANLGAIAPTKQGQPPPSDWPASSRGGTRTRDPGIMSAVL